MKGEMQKSLSNTKFTTEVQNLVKIPSVSGSEKTAQQYLYGQMEQFGSSLPENAGFSTFLQSVEGYDSPNVVALKKGNNGKGSKKAFILTGHIDTVSPTGSKEDWQGQDPWSGEIVEQPDGTHKIFGLGVSDMKMGLVVLEHVFQDLAQKDIDCDIWFVSAVNEELNGAGTEAFAKWFKEKGYVATYSEGIAAIFGEPRNLGSDSAILGIGNKANDFLIASKKVASHHSSEEGPNVINDMAHLVIGIEALNLIWKSSEFEEGLTPPHITPTEPKAPNKNLNSTPAAGSLNLDLRTTPHTQQNSLKQVVALAKSLGFSVEHAENPVVGAYTNPESPLVQAFREILIQKGIPFELQTTGSSTDAGFLQGIGIAETIMAGAGIEAIQHTVNEYAILEDGERAIGLTILACLKWIEMKGGETYE